MWGYSDGCVGKYLARKLKEKLLLQLSQTRDLATLTREAGPDNVTTWMQMDLDAEAPTPGTYRHRQAHSKPSVYVLNDEHGNLVMSSALKFAR